MRNFVRSCAVLAALVLFSTLADAQQVSRQKGKKPGPPDRKPLQALDLNGRRMGVTLTSFPNTTAVAWDLYQHQLTAEVVCGGTQTLSYALIQAPAGMSINTATGLISWTPTVGDVGEHPVVARVTPSGLPVCPTSARSATSFTLEVVELPSDPMDEGTAAPPDSSTSFFDEIRFLIDSGIQTDVDINVFDPDLASVIRGRVFDRDTLSPVSGVTVTVVNHAEYGQTLTRADGMFDMIVNGGEIVTASYDRGGYLDSQRSADVPANEYLCLADSALVVLDPMVTEVLLGENPTGEVAQGSVVMDMDGERQATVFFQPGVTAELVTDGSSQPIGRLNVRATEYTVGDMADEALPGTLPEGVDNTYAVEISADEALLIDADRVQFTSDLPVYVENFLDFDVGSCVPSAYYDPEEGVWVPAPNGLLIQILSTAGGSATLDVTGDGMAADGPTLAALGITDEEQEALSTTYEDGQELWRVPIDHFTAWSFAWPATPIEVTAGGHDSGAPNFGGNNLPDAGTLGGGSFIRYEPQVLQHEVPVVGTPYSLRYASNRVQGWRVERSISGFATPDIIPTGLNNVSIRVAVAGQLHFMTDPAMPGRIYTYGWDGKDSFDRDVLGGQTASVEIAYEYDGVYLNPADIAQAYGQGDGTTNGVPTRNPVNLSKTYRSDVPMRPRAVGAWDQRDVGLGGWTLDVLHRYDPDRQTLFLGAGARRGAQSATETITTVAGNGVDATAGDGGLATEASFRGGNGLAIGPDGSLYIAETASHRIRKVDGATGLISTVAGTGSGGFSGDGGPATAARLRRPYDVAVNRKGQLFIADFQNGRIRMVDTDGTISTIAGNGDVFSGPNGVQAIQSGIPEPVALDFARDGSLLIVEFARIVRRIDNSGIIEIIAGDGLATPGAGDGGPALDAGLADPLGIQAAADGSFYLADAEFLFGGGNKIRRVGSDGLITRLAGASNGMSGFSGEGGPADVARVNAPSSVAVTKELSFYFTDEGNNLIRYVDAKGIINTIGGTGDAGFSGEDGPAKAADLDGPRALILGPDGDLYFIDNNNYRVRRISSPYPVNTQGGLFTPSADGSLLYRFDATGRHEETINAANGTVLLSFAYDAESRLTSITDVDGNVTTILRDMAGNPLGITGPFGQVTDFTLDGFGYLASISNPNAEQHQYTYTADSDGLPPGPPGGGLMLTKRDPQNNLNMYSYGLQGELESSLDAAGGTQDLSRQDFPDGSYIVLHTSPTSVPTSYTIQTLATLEDCHTTGFANGTTKESVTSGDGVTATTLPDGTTVDVSESPDPVFGLQSPLKSLDVRWPPNRRLQVTRSKTALLGNPDDPTSVLTSTETVDINGNVHTYAWDALSSTLTRTTPEGRVSSAVFDAAGRVLTRSRAGVSPVQLVYDGDGQLMSITQGARVTLFGRNMTTGFLDTITDPAGQTHSFVRDLAGRVTTYTAPGPRSVSITYDANGNVMSVLPPGRPAHGFTYTPVDLVDLYNPPGIGLTMPQTDHDYNLDRKLELVTFPDGTFLDPTYDMVTGRLASETVSGGSTTFGYNAAGQLSSIATPSVTVAYAYAGAFLSSTTWSGAVSGVVSRLINNDVNISRHTVGGTNVNYTYDNDGLLIGAGSETIVRNATSGLIDSRTVGTVTQTLGYSAFGEPDSSMVSGITALGATRDNLGRITNLIDIVPVSTRDFTYTAAGQLDTVDFNSSQVSDYDYDANGNRTLHTINGTTMVAATYDDQDRLLTYGANSYTYTDNGQLASRNDGVNTTTYTYDAYGNLTSVVLPGPTTVAYVYDGNNRRVQKSVGGVVQQGFLYKDGLNPIAELDSSNSVVSIFVYGTKEHVPDYMIQGGTNYAIISNYVGSVRFVVNASTGAVAQQIDYDEFGNVLSDTNPGFQPFGFAGGLMDNDASLVLFGARNYDPEVGRFISKDPVRFGGGTNLYAYAGNDPVSHYDPTGLMRVAEAVDGPNQFAAGPDSFTLGLSAVRAGFGAGAGVPLAASSGNAAGNADGTWSGILGDSYDALLPGGMAESVGGTIPMHGNADARKWLRIADVLDSTAVAGLAAPNALWNRALDLLEYSDTVSQAMGDVDGALREQLRSQLSND